MRTSQPDCKRSCHQRAAGKSETCLVHPISGDLSSVIYELAAEKKKKTLFSEAVCSLSLGVAIHLTVKPQVTKEHKTPILRRSACCNCRAVVKAPLVRSVASQN